jgi:hypothetical protein
MMIAGAVVLVLLCCCCVVVAGGVIAYQCGDMFMGTAASCSGF